MNLNSMMTDDALLNLIGERLCGLRLARNFTQQQLAEPAGLGLRTVQRWPKFAEGARLAEDWRDKIQKTHRLSLPLK